MVASSDTEYLQAQLLRKYSTNTILKALQDPKTGVNARTLRRGSRSWNNVFNGSSLNYTRGLITVASDFCQVLGKQLSMPKQQALILGEILQKNGFLDHVGSLGEFQNDGSLFTLTTPRDVALMKEKIREVFSFEER